MAKVTFSPLISGMRGRTAGVVFSVWKGIAYIRSWVIPSNPQTVAQTLQREALADTLTCWQSIKSWAKAVWDKYGTGYQMSGYNAYMRHNIMDIKAGTAGKFTPYNPDYSPVSEEAAVAGGSGVVTCSWTDDDASADDKVRTYFRKTETAAEEYAWTFDAETAASAETKDITGLDTGEEYEVAFMAKDSVDDEHAEAFNAILTAG